MVPADNGCGPGKLGIGAGYPGNDAYLHWLMKLDEAEGGDRYDPDTWRCLFAVAPDVVGDASATLARSERFLPLIREYTRFPAALVAQNGQEDLPVPWEDFDVLFLGGSAECIRCRYVRPVTDFTRKRCPSCRRPLIEWKLGDAARDLTAQASARGNIRMGRVNSRQRIRYANEIGCDSCDGTYLTKGPDKNLPRLLAWMRQIDSQIPLHGRVLR
jgi:hypothetical protein